MFIKSNPTLTHKYTTKAPTKALNTLANGDTSFRLTERPKTPNATPLPISKKKSASLSACLEFIPVNTNKL